MLKNLPVIFTICSLFIFGCKSKSENKTTGAADPFYGNWISINYRDSLNIYGSPGKIKNVDLDELIINYTADSLCLNVEGVETHVFKIIGKSATTFRINKFNQDEFTEFAISSDGKELSYLYKKYNQKFRFFKAEPKYAVKITNGWRTAAQLYFNELTFAANYLLLNGDGKPASKVAFTSYGKIEGLQGYTEFSVCYQGDCRSMTDGDLITLSDGASSDNYIYEWNKGVLIFYSISNTALRDEMPHYEKATEIFRFKKKM
ncbi:MAG: hypothetical protein ABIT08_09175 [Bacteroidia bacterium]